MSRGFVTLISSVETENLNKVFNIVGPRTSASYIADPAQIIKVALATQDVEPTTKERVLYLMDEALLKGRSSLDISKFGPFFAKAMSKVEDKEGVLKILRDLSDPKKLPATFAGDKRNIFA